MDIRQGRFFRFADRHWRRFLVVGAALFVGFAGWLAAGQRGHVTKAEPLEARLELAAGEVTLKRGGDEIAAWGGAALLDGTTVRTGAGARALARLSDGSTLFFREGSTVTLSRGRVVLEAGELWIDAPHAEREPVVYDAGPGQVTAADAGLSLARHGDDVTVYVARGLATFTTAAGREEVRAGEQASAQAGAAPEVSAVAFWEDWTGGMGDHRAAGPLGTGAGRIYGVVLGGEPGVAPEPLEVARQNVHVVLRDGLAETAVDQTFLNPGAQDVEGWYWFTVPEGASVTGFALETDGVLVEGELIERKEAAAQYTAAVNTGHQPALLEWVDARTYRARIFPVRAGGTRRVQLRYLQLLPQASGTVRYVYPLAARPAARIGEFGLTVDLGEAGRRMNLTTLADARVEDDGRTVTMRRSGFLPRADFLLEATLLDLPPPVRAARFSTGPDTADYVMVRYRPNFAGGLTPRPADVVVVVDTSAAGDDSVRQLKAATAEAILRALSDEDRFALLALDVKPTVLHPAEGLAAAKDDEVSKALEALASHPYGGATDLAALFDEALARVHGAEQPAVIYIGDGLATSGDLGTEALTERLRRSLSTSRARLFTVAAGGDADDALLDELARVGGGSALHVASSEDATDRALRLLAAIKTPTLTDLALDLGAGLDEVFSSATGKVTRGEEVVVLARTHHPLPEAVTVRGRLAGEAVEEHLSLVYDRSVAAAFVPRLWGAEKIRRTLGVSGDSDAERGRVVLLGTEYGLMTPYTSFLALESEHAYSQRGIQRRRSPLMGVRLASLGDGAPLSTSAAALALEAIGIGCSDRGGMFTLSAPAPEMQAKMERAEPAAPSVAYDDGAARERDAIGALRQVAAKEDFAKTVAAGGGWDKDAADLPAEGPARFAGLGLAASAPEPKRASGKKARKRPQSRPADEKTPLVDREERFSRTSSRAPTLEVCSDVSTRPLAQRRLLWRKRMKSASRQPGALYQVWATAASSCELPDWRSEAALLRLLATRVEDEGTARYVLSRLSFAPEAQSYLGRMVLRRATDPHLVATIEDALFGAGLDRVALARELSELDDDAARVARLQEVLARHPDDPQVTVQLVERLAGLGRMGEALLHGRRLRDQGLMTPALARRLGDVLAAHDLEDEAVRTYSEIVEFDAGSAASRRLLGDIYLAHGWYAQAYRQYQTLTDAEPVDPAGWLRLAAAAAGDGRVDEALRIERQVARAEGRPGPADPRRWARLASAARIARMMKEGAPEGAKVDDDKWRRSLERQLKQLGLFKSSGRLVVLTWEDLELDLAVSTERKGAPVTVGERTEAAAVGLSATLAATADLDDVDLFARLKSPPPGRPVTLVRHDITWDGTSFTVDVKPTTLDAGRARAAL